jgi:hypothetical protein
MTPQRKGSRRGSGWKPPRDRREIAVAVLASLAIVVVTVALIWFLRPNRNSGSSTPVETVPTTTTVPGETTLVPPTEPPTTAPTSSSTP